MLCLGAGSLLVCGCTGSSRDGYAAAGSRPAAPLQAGAGSSAGRAKLVDRRPDKARRTAGPQTAQGGQPARNRPPGSTSQTAVRRKIPRPGAAPAGPVSVAAQPVRTAPSRANQAAAVQPAAHSEVAPAQRVAASSPEAAVKKPAAQPVVANAPATSPSDQVARRSAPRTQRSKAGKTTEEASPQVAQSAGAAVTPRQRADRLMERARNMLSHNFRDEALRLASVAEQLEKAELAVYETNEDRPSRFVAQLQHKVGEHVAPLAQAVEQTAAHEVAASRLIHRSTPVDPQAAVTRRGRVELTEILPGWQPAAGVEEVSSDAASAADSSPSTQSQLALAETTASAPAAPPAETSELISAPAPQPSAEATAASQETSSPPPPTADTDTASDSTATVDAADEEPPPRSAIRWSGTATAGLAAGIAGLLGLAWWRRQERRHYAAAQRPESTPVQVT